MTFLINFQKRFCSVRGAYCLLQISFVSILGMVINNRKCSGKKNKHVYSQDMCSKGARIEKFCHFFFHIFDILLLFMSLL